MIPAFKKRVTTFIIIVANLFAYSLNTNAQAYSIGRTKFPYKKAGLTQREAAAHLLNRFSYGATPGQIDEIVKMGLEKWFEQQLNANQLDDNLNQRIDSFPDRTLTNQEVLAKYPQNFVVVHMAVEDSVISKDSVDRAFNKKAYNEQVQAYMKKKGFKPDQQLYKQFISEQILRACYSNNQLKEVLTDFWFNHFNVSFTKGESASFIPAYMRDVIRPNVLGKFDQLLLATAKSPAMLYYLDNFNSQGASAPPRPATTMMAEKNTMMASDNMMMGSASIDSNKKVKTITRVPPKNVAGLNENYAREVMELHTMGVDGGYTQSDVTQAARILTGWTIYPISGYGYGSAMKGVVARVGEGNLASKGYVREGDFLFTPNRHDKVEKTVLGKSFGPDNGYQEGIELLEMLAHHASTAKFIATKLAVRFVTDNPSKALISRLAETFTKEDGDIKKVLAAMAASPEFWDTKAVREKTKSPFELAVSSVRSLNADVKDPYQLFTWITRMGQKIYYYQAPTGFPDKAQYWINTGALLNRMNFGLALASGRIPGITVNLKALNNQHEPESAEAALTTYSKIVMPERKLDNTFKQLAPMLNQPNIASKISEAASKATVSNSNTTSNMAAGQASKYSGMDAMPVSEETTAAEKKKEQETLAKANAAMALASANMLSQVVGIIIGSPEFQRR